MNFWNSFWDIIWWFVWAFAFIAYLFALFTIVVDLFRDTKLNGWWKALWLICLLFIPFLTALVYLVVRGRGMAERSQREAAQAADATQNYIRSVAGASPADEIAKAKALLDAGTITPTEYEALKAKALRTDAAV